MANNNNNSGSDLFVHLMSTRARDAKSLRSGLDDRAAQLRADIQIGGLSPAQKTRTSMAEADLLERSAKIKKEESSARLASGVTLIGAELTKGHSQWANSQLNIMANNRQAGEIEQRADLITGEILSQGRKVQGEQAGAFIKSGVKLSGSALNVMDETADKALEAASSARREADFALGNIAMQTAVEEVDSDFAAFNTLLGAGQSAAFAFG